MGSSLESFFSGLEVGSLDDGSAGTVEVLASDNAGFLHLPGAFLYRLGISPTSAANFKRPGGSVVEIGIVDVRVLNEDRSSTHAPRIR